MKTSGADFNPGQGLLTKTVSEIFGIREISLRPSISSRECSKTLG